MITFLFLVVECMLARPWRGSNLTQVWWSNSTVSDWGLRVIVSLTYARLTRTRLKLSSRIFIRLVHQLHKSRSRSFPFLYKRAFLRRSGLNVACLRRQQSHPMPPLDFCGAIMELDFHVRRDPGEKSGQ